MLSIVVPVFNGDKNLNLLFEKISSAASLIKDRVELIFVDDGSTDNSLQTIRNLCLGNKHPQNVLNSGWLSLESNCGQQMAVLCGLRHSLGDYVITMDDDLEHPPEIICRLYDEMLLLQGSVEYLGVVYAVSESSGYSLFRKWGAAARDIFFRLFLGKPADLRIGSFRIFSRAAVDAICSALQPFVYISAEVFRAGFKAASIEYKTDEYKAYESNSDENKSQNSGASHRYSTGSRMSLYLKLIRWYGVFGSRKADPQYTIAEKGGCL